MAKCQIKMPEDFLLSCSRLAERTDTVLSEVLQDGGRVVLAQTKSNLQAVIGKTKRPSQSTGELVSSLGLSPVLVDRDGNHNIKIGFNEPRRKQYVAKKKRSYYTVTNAMIANVLEYGRHGQRARPFLRPAKNASRKAAIGAMRDRLEREIDRL